MAVTAAVVGLGVLGAPGATAAPPAPGSRVVDGWAPAGRAGVHPGVVTETAGGGACTANFVFTAGGRVLLGQAAHCGGTGGPNETGGCEAGTVPLGTAVTVRGSDGRNRTGTLAYSSWVAMQAAGLRDPAACAHNDFALVALSPADAADVNPSVPVLGGPRRVHDGPLPIGDRLFTYQDSPVRMGVAALRPKTGTYAGPVGGGFGHQVYTVTPGVPGDSGSGYLTADGAAFGVLSTVDLAPLPLSNGVTDLARAMRYAAGHGYADLTLVPGTEPFAPNPVALGPQL